MKQLLFFLAVFFLCSRTTHVAIAQESEEIQVFVSHQRLQLEQTPIIIGDSVLLPLRVVAECLGAEISTDFSSTGRFVYISANSRELTLEIDSLECRDNSGNIIMLDVPPLIINGRTMVPISFLAESLGAEVSWQPEISTLYISLPNSDIPALPADYKFPFDEYYISPSYDAYFNETLSPNIGELVTFEGFIQEIRYISDTDLYEAVITKGSQIILAQYNSNIIEQTNINSLIRAYGAYMGIGSEGAPLIMLLRCVDEDGSNRAAKTSGFEIASAFEGHILTEPSDIENFLYEKAQGFGNTNTPYFTFQVLKSDDFDYSIVISFNENHPMGNALKFANITYEQRENIKEILREYMRAIAFALTQKCPGLVLEGYYTDILTVLDENGDQIQYTMRHASWTNDINIPALGENYFEGPIIWLKNKDRDWVVLEEW